MVTPICEIINLLKPATTLTFWECVREYWIQFQQNRKAARDFAGPIRGREETPEAEAERKRHYRTCMEHAETFRVLGLDTMAPFWRGFESLSFNSALRSKIPIHYDSNLDAINPDVLALAMRSVVDDLRAMVDVNGCSDSPGVEQGVKLDTMIRELIWNNHERINLSARKLAELVLEKYGRKVSHTAIMKTEAWKGIKAGRALEQADRATRGDSTGRRRKRGK